MPAEKVNLREPDARPDLLVIAGEHSGDAHAARLVQELHDLQPEWKVAAMGGPALAQRSQLIFDLVDHSVVGLFEVLKHYAFFKDLFKTTLAWIERHRPKAILLVDYPGFNLRLAETLARKGLSCKGGGEIRLLYYISPQVWAWKGHRRHKMADLLDALAVIFPFEDSFYSDTSLPVQFVGHPFVGSAYRNPLSYNPDAPILLAPGSRRQAVKRIFPRMLEGFAAYRAREPGALARVPYPDASIKTELELVLAHQNVEGIELVPASRPLEASAVLTSSGTMSLQCALAALPGAIIYVAHPLTYLIGRRLVKIPHLGIANLILEDDPPYPELIQRQARPQKLANLLHLAKTDSSFIRSFHAAASRLREALSVPVSAKAAEWLNGQLDP